MNVYMYIHIWNFPWSWGYPMTIIQLFRLYRTFHKINQPFLGTSRFLESTMAHLAAGPLTPCIAAVALDFACEIDMTRSTTHDSAAIPVICAVFCAKLG